jgi:DNA-binding transcriptional ArsR family regulator
MNHAAVPLDRTFHALGDPTRLGMIEQLSRGPASVKALAEPLEMALPSVMKHLRVLEEGHLVVSEKSGRVRTYRMKPHALAAIDRWVSQRRAAWNRKFDRLERLVTGIKDGGSGGDR